MAEELIYQRTVLLTPHLTGWQRSRLLAEVEASLWRESGVPREDYRLHYRSHADDLGLHVTVTLYPTAVYERVLRNERRAQQAREGEPD